MWPFRKKKSATFGFSVALLIDMQPYFVDQLEAGRREPLIQAQVKMIHLCATKDIPLIVLEYRDCGQTIPQLKAEIDKVPRVTTVTKSFDDGFDGTRLHSVLKNLGATSLLLMGINASCCVLDTARSATKKRYQIITADDIIADNPSNGGPETEKWYRRNGILLPEAQLITGVI